MSGNAGERAISPVVGIALMIVIVVLLVGAVGTYLTGFSEELDDPAPRFSPSIKYNDTYRGNGQALTVSHQSGSVIPTDDIRIRVKDASIYDSTSPSADEPRAVYEGNVLEEQLGQNFSASETFVLNKSVFRTDGGSTLGSDEYLNLTEAEVRMVWTSADGSRTAIIFEWRGPEDFNPDGE